MEIYKSYVSKKYTFDNTRYRLYKKLNLWVKKWPYSLGTYISIMSLIYRIEKLCAISLYF